MNTRWYVSLRRLWEGRYNVSVYKAPEFGGSPASLQETVHSLASVKALLKTLEPQRSAHLLVGKNGPIVEPDDVPPGETVEECIAQGLRKLESEEATAHFVVVGPPLEEMEATFFKWRDAWKDRK